MKWLDEMKLNVNPSMKETYSTQRIEVIGKRVRYENALQSLLILSGDKIFERYNIRVNNLPINSMVTDRVYTRVINRLKNTINKLIKEEEELTLYLDNIAEYEECLKVLPEILYDEV